LGGEGGDDEAAERGVELVGGASRRGSGRRSGRAEKLGVGAGNVFVGGFAVLDVTVLPPGEAVGVGHLKLALADGFGEGADGTLAALGERPGVGVHDCIRMGSTVAGAHNDALLGGEPATKVVEGKSGGYFCHREVNVYLYEPVGSV